MKQFLLILLTLTIALLVACNGDKGGTGDPNILYYSCSMHPFVHQPKPGPCPVCQMALTPVYKQGAETHAEHATPKDLAEGAVHLTSERQQLIGVRTATVTRTHLRRTIRTIGNIEPDETRRTVVNTRISGWVQDLFVNYVGRTVRAGEPLLTIYSPELLASEQEYLLAYRNVRELDSPAAREMLAAARQRLELWEIRAEQIAELERAGKPQTTVTLYAPRSGIVMKQEVLKGARIEAGQMLLEIMDLTHVWMQAFIYEYELSLVKLGQTAKVELSAMPGQSREAKLTFISPTIEEMTRRVKLRLELDNADLLLKPDMWANIELTADLGERITIPTEAVLDSGERKVVFIDRGEGYFEPRNVKLDQRAGDMVEVLSGLKEGERVVASGTFLIDSESRLKSATGDQAPTEKKPAGHQH